MIPAAFGAALIGAISVATFALAWIPLAAYPITPDRTNRAMNAAHAWQVVHARESAAVVFLAVGIYEIIHGILRLA